MIEAIDYRRHWIAASQAVIDARKMLADAALTLPIAPSSGLCPACGGNSWEIQEGGYTRGSTAELQPATEDAPEEWAAWSDGSDDWSDSGDEPEVLVCTNGTRTFNDVTERHDMAYCGLVYRCPADLIWS